MNLNRQNKIESNNNFNKGQDVKQKCSILREAIEPEEEKLLCDVETEIYRSDKFENGILSQLEHSNKLEDGEFTNQLPFQSCSIDVDTVKSCKTAPFYHLDNYNLLDDGFEQNFINRMSFVNSSFPVPTSDQTHTISCNFHINQRVWDCLLEYQREGIKWLCDLHTKDVGGILSDEMGLGKTVQIISFLSVLHLSALIENKSDRLKHSLILVPATILCMWMLEFYNWWPFLRIVILHSTGTLQTSIQKFLNKCKETSIVLTTYSTFIKHERELLSTDWNYVILDEGHKIKNPVTIINTLSSKLKTHHRLIVSGTPVQNNLKELWSLFDFIYPGLLGDLDSFLKNVAYHITRAGYSNASLLQVQTGYRCAKMLKMQIEPFLLRRTKQQVFNQVDLPRKSDFIIFCGLTKVQKKLYINLLKDERFIDILNRKNNQIFKCLQILRKICNHPCIFKNDLSYDWRDSAKMIALDNLLSRFLTKNRVLVYSQSKKVLNLIQKYCDEKEFTYLRLDGDTSIASRKNLVDDFNKNTAVFIFLLTTKVGGVGISLIGADRVILFDPDWNPSTDAQANERAWRIGQTKEVIVYRLITSGTIEEKIYNRQIFKQFLANRVLENPAQSKSTLSFGDINELFTYDEKKKSDDPKMEDAIPDKLDVSPQKKKKRKYKWRKDAEDSSDDNITPMLLMKSSLVKKIKSTEEEGTCIDSRLIAEEAQRIATDAIKNLQAQSSIQHPISNQPVTRLSLEIYKSLTESSKIELPSNSLQESNYFNSDSFSSEAKKFILAKGGSVTSKEIVGKFRSRISNGSDSLAFKFALKNLCDKSYNKDKKVGIWYLKNEYK